MGVLTFEQCIQAAAAKGEAINSLFEERLFDLVGVLHKIAAVLAAENVSYELIGGLAVLVHVEEADPEHTTLTRDVDLMIRREDLERIKEAASRHDFRFRHAAGVDMLVYGARYNLHLIFSDENVSPRIAPVRKTIHGGEVMVIPVPDLVWMKLSSFRDKDRV